MKEPLSEFKSFCKEKPMILLFLSLLSCMGVRLIGDSNNNIFATLPDGRQNIINIDEFNALSDLTELSNVLLNLGIDINGLDIDNNNIIIAFYSEGDNASPRAFIHVSQSLNGNIVVEYKETVNPEAAGDDRFQIVSLEEFLILIGSGEVSSARLVSFPTNVKNR